MYFCDKLYGKEQQMGRFYLKNFTGGSLFNFFIQYGHHEHSLDMHGHADFFELTIVLDGTAMHNVNGESYFIKKGDVFGVNNIIEHSFTECHDFKICNIMFRPEEIFAPFPDLKHCPGFHSLFFLEQSMMGEQNYKSRLRLNINDFEETKRLLDRIIKEYQGCRAGFVSTVTAYFIELVSFLVRRYDSGQSVNDRISTFSQAVAYMEKSFTEKISVDEIAKKAGLSVRHFQRQFKNTYLITPQDYITSLRMQKAMLMLSRTKDSITEIAWECGYHDSSLFSRRFKMYTGVSPREYRTQKC